MLPLPPPLPQQHVSAPMHLLGLRLHASAARALQEASSVSSHAQAQRAAAGRSGPAAPASEGSDVQRVRAALARAVGLPLEEVAGTGSFKTFRITSDDGIGARVSSRMHSVMSVSSLSPA